MSNVVNRKFEDVAIDSTGEVVSTSIQESVLVGVEIAADDTADYALDVSPDGNTYFEAEATYTDTDEVRDVFELSDRYIKIRVTTAASANSTADIFIDGVEY